MPAIGARRLRSTSIASAFSGDTYRMRALGDPPSPRRGFGETVPLALRAAEPNITWSIAQRNAVSVLPLPVGARMTVESPRAIAGHPWACGGVGAVKLARNHSATDGWNRLNTSARFAT